jgi:hypothetical protein
MTKDGIEEATHCNCSIDRHDFPLLASRVSIHSSHGYAAISESMMSSGFFARDAFVLMKMGTTGGQD